jgi:uncharacterized protein
MGPAVPTLPAERIVTLDILRGFALLGILVVNMASFAGGTGQEPTPLPDRVAGYIISVFFDGKFNSLFSLLFAIGFTLQIDRLEQRSGSDWRWIHVRRLCVLFAIGIAHAILVWNGDILHYYALLGFVLMALRNVSDRTIIMLAAVLLLIPSLRSLALLLFSTPEFTAAGVAFRQEAASSAAVLGSGSYFDVVARNLWTLQRNYLSVQGLERVIQLGYVVFLVTMLLGLLAGRHRWIQRAGENPALLRRVQWWALGVGVAGGVVAAIADQFLESSVPSVWFIVYRSAYSVSRVALMAFYAATIIRLALHPASLRWLSPLAAAGRMPLTNYLLQSVLCTAIFYGWGLGLRGQVGTAGQIGIAFAIFFGLQVPLSVVWLRRFAFGPMEYLWRLASYCRRPPTAMARNPAP